MKKELITYTAKMKSIIFSVFQILSTICFPQEAKVVSDTIRNDALNVFMSAGSYIKKEIAFINYVRDIKVADLYIISTYQGTGSGGEATTYFLVGQNKYRGMNDTIIVNTSPDDTEETARIKEVNSLKMGLMRYVLRTPLSGFFDIRFTQPVTETISSDKWNSWVFNASVQGYISGQKTSNSSYLFGDVSANRITEKSKFENSLGYNRQQDKITYTDTNNVSTTYSSISQDKYFSSMFVKSLGNHWSIGGSVGISTSYYSNFDLRISLMPGIEYDIFPYSESTRRQLRILYRIGMEINNYISLNERLKEKEELALQSLTAAFSIIQKWGLISANMSWQNYFFDLSYNNLSLSGRVNIRIIKGLSFNTGGSFAMVNDQISLPSTGASLQDVLLQRKMQKTNYRFYTNFGLTYTFGSIYNNVVNPRFSSSGMYY
jgi:hypothetical protein